MKLSKKELNLEEGMRKEWIISNGIGGFSSSTVIGANTRRYHGLLIAPLNPPAKRHLIFSKIDESVTINNESYNLSTNFCRNYVSEGYKNLDSFSKEYIPEFNYKVNDLKISKKVCMVYGKNTVVVQYIIRNGKNPAKLTLAPIANFRDFHSLTPERKFQLKQDIDKTKVKLDIDGINAYMFLSDGAYIKHENDVFKNMYYFKEEERGFSAEEDLIVPGVYEIDINPKETKELTFVASLENKIEDIDSNEIIENEIQRLKKIIEDSGLIKKKSRPTKTETEYNQFINSLVISADSFIIIRGKAHSILAGFPWFLDWGRDSLIAFEGLLLVTKRYDLARDLLINMTKDIKDGLVPNGYSEYNNKPLYNSADSSLLLFEQVNRYLKYTKDYDFIKDNIYNTLKKIVKNYISGINLDGNNIYIEENGLLHSGTEQIQNTWMDAKIGDYVVTPRNGVVVEINALWYNALKTLEYLANKFEEGKKSEEYKKMASSHKKVFEEKFYNENKKSLYDVLGDDKIRPNQLFTISTTYSVIKPSSDIGKTIFKTVTNKLLNRYGLQTLAKGEDNFTDVYEGSPYKRDMSYHQGITWVWLLGLYSDAYLNMIADEKDRLEKEKLKVEYGTFVKNVYTTFKREINEKESIDSISELYNSKTPFNPAGAYAQAWSISEILKIVTKPFELK